ncbi:MAG TPA: Ig domain-containing protein, partial [Pyrinomonadaceae bacterium]|nr:Ig domain-containing protein [Pyrinomonadaceae bacterium]
MIVGTTPGFVDAASQDFHLQSTSAAVNAGTSLHSDVLPANAPVRQYVLHQAGQARPVSGILDLGAFEYLSSAPMQIMTSSLPDGIRGRGYHQTVQASGGSGSYFWSVSSGDLPPGLVLDAATGVIRGRAKLKGNWSFTITVADAQQPATTVSQTFTVRTFLYSLL